jgi:hypothetical protein
MNHEFDDRIMKFAKVFYRIRSTAMFGGRAPFAFLASLLILCAWSGRAQDASAGTGAADYDQMVSSANNLLKDGKLEQAQQTAEQAVKANPANYLAYAVEAKIASKQNQPDRAKQLIDTALTLAPDADKDKVRQLAAMLAPGGASPQTAPSKALSDEDQLKLDGLMLILDNADKTQNADDRRSAYRDFLTQSTDFADAHPEQTNIWLMRAFACVELDYPGEGFLAGRHLKALGAVHSEDPKVHHVMAELESKDWLGDKRAYRDWSKWTTDQVKAAANASDEEAQWALGGWYEKGMSSLQQDYVEAAQWYRKAAEQGDGDGQNDLGRMYQSGWGVDKDFAQAANWYRKGADQGEDWAQNNLGFLYQQGWGVDRDYALAISWYRKAADQGNSQAENSLGFMYQNGFGVDKDNAQAVSWYRKSADQGNSQGEHGLGYMYQYGLGVNQDYTQALALYHKSADQGDSNGENDLGVMYANGWGIDKDYAQAVSWIRKSADQGNSSAEKNLAVLYENGWGVEKSVDDALTWYRKAAAQGNTDAQAALKRLNASS